MDLGFHGETAELYDTYRHGYPPAVIEVLADAFGLSDADVVIDLGCGTGQLTLPLARQVRAVAGVDPEPDMISRARRNAADQGLANVSWMVGADTDMPALAALLGDRSVGAVTIGQALHWMSHDELFRVLAPLVRPDGGVAVLANGTPLWLQDSAWSRALRGFLEQWLGMKLTAACGTDEHSQQRYRDALTSAGFDVTTASVDYEAELSVDQVVGGLYSAFPVDRLPVPAQRPAFAARVRAALQPAGHVTEPVHVAIQLARVR